MKLQIFWMHLRKKHRVLQSCLQSYCILLSNMRFSGGIDIVMGVAELFGIKDAKLQAAVFFRFIGRFLAEMAYFSRCMDERLCILSVCTYVTYAKIWKMGEKASECSFWACTSGIYCKYSGIFPCWISGWVPNGILFSGDFIMV